MFEAVWVIPTLPLVGFVLLLAFGRRLREPWPGWLATAMVAGSFAAAVVTFVGLLDLPADERRVVYSLFEWFSAGSLEVDVGFLVDPLSLAMVLFITGVGTLIHLYSIGYMHGDERYATFFVYLNLFVVSMLVLVLGENLLLTFVGWEGVGACSYLLISFWFSDEANASAGKKAFITNRVGDVGFMLAMFLVFSSLGSLQYEFVLEHAESLAAVTATAIALLLFVGAIGKSAQLPLYVWLPDAMAGPTPVSALIHAATMVTAGVYLLTRVSPILAQADDWVPTLIASIGAATAFFAATVAVAQRDIKKVLAYSTISQLGYMFLAVGSGAYVAAIFHMITHAFFKAVLFLGAGSVIHGLHDEQDMRRMGALRRFMPVTASTFIVGWLAIAGVFPFSGFWSKDEILLFAWQEYPVLWAVGLVTALLTAFYMSRQVFLVFFGSPRWDEGSEHDRADDEATAETGGEMEGVAHAAGAEAHGRRPHESPWTMTLPLVVLAVLAAVGGVLNLPFNHDVAFLERWLAPVLEEFETVSNVSGSTELILSLVALAASLLGIAVAGAVYLAKRLRPVEPEVLRRAWYVDDALSAFMAGPGRELAEGAAVVDARGIDGAVNGLAAAVQGGGSRLRVVQSGYVRNYALGMALGAVLLVGFFITRAGI